MSFRKKLEKRKEELESAADIYQQHGDSRTVKEIHKIVDSIDKYIEEDKEHTEFIQNIKRIIKK